MPLPRKQSIQTLHGFFAAAILILSLWLGGCGGGQQTQTTQKPAETGQKPAATPSKLRQVNFRVGSIDLSKGTGFKIEQTHINQIASLLKKEEIDIFSIQAVSRYPGLTGRVDIVDALSAASGMSKAFGENTTISGRQTGNAVFARYPIVSQNNTQFSGIRSTNFESALQAMVDIGDRQVVLVSAELPAGASRNDLLTCLSTLDGFRSYYVNNPLVVTGNLPRDEMAKQFAMFKGVNPQGSAIAPRIWYAGTDSMKVLYEKIVKSPIGDMTVAEIGLFLK